MASLPAFRTLDQLAASGRRIVVRVDLNVPVENGEVRDATRIERIVPTIGELLDKGAAVILLAHFDRPKGKIVPEMSLEPVAPALARALGRPVTFVATDWRDGKAVAAARKAEPGQCLLMENTRYHPGEEKNDPELAGLFASLGDAYVNDAFSAAHRAHASTEGIAHLLPAYAGRAMEAELRALESALDKPKRPLVAVVGGAKVSTKLELLGNLAGIADVIVIGGGMANTFLAAEGHPVGRSLCEHDLAPAARDVVATAKSKSCEILLPVDGVVAREFKAGSPHRVADAADVKEDEMILDAGPASVAAIKAAFDKAGTVVWNGPLGAFELAPFDAATNEAARHAAALTKAGRLVSVAGGGDTVAALNRAGAADGFSYVSTAGGAFLEWLEGKPLPGVRALRGA
ncbi:MAG: phosphoglycerate kinase [Parvibaculaceae bacterium]